MNEVNPLQLLGQVPVSQAVEVFRDFLRGHVREVICEAMAAEVTEPRGTKMSPHLKPFRFKRDTAAHAAARYDFRCPPSSLSQTIFCIFKSTTGGSSHSRTGGRLPRAEWQRR